MRFTASGADLPIQGAITVPGDKSISHRALIFASLADGVSTVRGFLRAEDTLATLHACRQLGVDILDDGERIEVSGRGLNGLQDPGDAIDLGNSGTAMRLLCGVMAAQKFASVLRGDQSLQSRPMARIVEPLNRMGAAVSAQPDGCAPLTIAPVDALNPIEYSSAVASAQVKSCVLLAGLCASVAVRVDEPQKSRDHSERMLAAMGADVRVDGLSVSLAPGQKLCAIDMVVPGDPSSAAFGMVAACLVPASKLRLNNVGLNPCRDGIIRVLQRMGAAIDIRNKRGSGGEQVADLHV
jgi:3-phosphoshikimate 1-carboxyvinyltransferase